MILFLIAIDLLMIGLLGAVYSFVAAEARRGRDIVLELTNYKHLAEDMLPVLRMMLFFAMLFFACLCSMLVGQVWIAQTVK